MKQVNLTITFDEEKLSALKRYTVSYTHLTLPTNREV